MNNKQSKQSPPLKKKNTKGIKNNSIEVTPNYNFSIKGASEAEMKDIQAFIEKH